jgi:hypothetical protein
MLVVGTPKPTSSPLTPSDQWMFELVQVPLTGMGLEKPADGLFNVTVTGTALATLGRPRASTAAARRLRLRANA